MNDLEIKLVNHGVPESLMKETVEACDRFLNQTMEEKLKFAGRDVWEPIRFGTSIDIKVAANCFLWRDFLKLFVHPDFNAPTKPEGLRFPLPTPTPTPPNIYNLLHLSCSFLYRLLF